MSKVSRASLKESPPYNSDGDEQSLSYMDHIQLDFIEVADDDTPKDVDDGLGAEGANEEESTKDEYEFPLFSISSTSSTSKLAQDNKVSENDKITHEGASHDTRIMKVSLQEHMDEDIKNERPLSYYIACYSEEEKRNFSAVAITGDDIMRMSQESSNMPHLWKRRVLDVDTHNMLVEQEKETARSHKHSRPGKKKRQARIECKERKIVKKRIEKEIQKQKEAKLKKKMFHKRGGKKHKKEKPTSQKQAKYRTE